MRRQVWDEQRIMAKERDCFCCVMCCAKPDGCCKCCFVDDEKADLCCYKEGGHLRGFVANYYAPAIKNIAFKVVVIIIFVGFFVFGVIVTPLLSENFSLRFFVPSDNPLITTFDIADNEFNNKNGISVDIMMDHRKPNNEVAIPPASCPPLPPPSLPSAVLLRICHVSCTCEARKPGDVAAAAFYRSMRQNASRVRASEVRPPAAASPRAADGDEGWVCTADAGRERLQASGGRGCSGRWLDKRMAGRPTCTRI